MNRVILMGRLTRDPDVRYSQGANANTVAHYTLAVDRRFKRNNDDQTADFIRCTVWGRGAEFAEKYLHQGTKVVVSGRIQTGSYTDRNGQRVNTFEVVVDDQEFAESKNSGGQSSYQGGAQQSSYSDRPAASSSIDDGFINIPDGVEDDGLPFN